MRTLRVGLLGLALAVPQQLNIPAPQGYVNDFAGVIPADSKARIESIVQDVRTKSGGDIAVVTLADLSGRDKADVALQIGRQWGVGRKGNPGDPARNTGVVVLLVPKETSADGRGHVEISTGSGAEGFITDATAGAIQDEALPFLRQADYGHALELITLRVAQRFASNFNFSLDTTLRAPAQQAPNFSPGGGGRGSWINRVPPALWIFLFFIILSALSGGRRRRGCGGCIPIFLPWGGGWGGGGFGGGRGGWGGGGGGFGGGGFGGFGGGGGFSGGGAGRDW
jgi:uncharacterized protein